MFPATRARAMFASLTLLLQNAAALPAFAVEPTGHQLDWATPLDVTILGAVNALGMSDLPDTSPSPISVRGDLPWFLAGMTGEAVQVAQAGTLELPRTSTDTWTSLGEIAQPAPQGFHGISQTETNISLAVTLNGMTNFAYVRQ